MHRRLSRVFVAKSLVATTNVTAVFRSVNQPDRHKRHASLEATPKSRSHRNQSHIKDAQQARFCHQNVNCDVKATIYAPAFSTT